MKRILSTITVLALCLSLCPTWALAAEEKASGDFSGFHWTLDDSGTLTITGTGDMPSAYNASWRQYKEDINEVIVGDGVTSIGNYAFENYTSLKMVKLPDGVTSIGNSAFNGCTNLTSIELPDSIISIGSSAFSLCTNLALVELPANLTSIGQYAFIGCENLKLTEFPPNLTSIERAAFQTCTNLALTKLPDGLTLLGDFAFANCSSLALTELPNNLTSIGKSTFFRCYDLALTKLPDGLTSIGESAFYYCSSLALTELPAGLTSIGEAAFYKCGSLTKLTFTKDDAPTLGRFVFEGCDNLTIYIPDTATSYTAENNWPVKKIAHNIIIQNNGNGTAYASPTSAAAGATITLTATANNGYHFKEWQVISGGVTISSNSFTMPATDVIIKANFEQDIPPLFTAHPSNATVAAGKTAVFTVTVSGESALAIQWQVSKDGSSWEDISGATENSYTTEATSKSMNGWKYRCIAANSAGSTTSNEATLTVQSTDTRIQTVSVNGTAGTISGTAITVILPFGITPPTDSSKVVITPATGATATNLQVSDNGVKWTFTVTAEDGTTTADYTIYVSNAPNPAAQNIADIAAAKSAIESKSWTVAQTTANTETAIKAWIGNQLQGMGLDGITCTVSISDFTAATTGSEADKDGANGSFTFTVSLSKGTGDTLATNTTTAINGTITATPYQARSYTVSISANPAAGGTVSGGGTYTENTSVTATATVKDGYHFVKWMEGGNEVSTSVNYTFTITGNRTLVAVFEKDDDPIPPQPIRYNVTVQTEGSGTASASPTSAAEGTTVSLTATANSGYHFKEWKIISGGVTISGNSFTMPAGNVTVKAVFEREEDPIPPQPVKYTVTMQTDGNGTATVSPTSATEGTMVSLTATANSGYHFKEWKIISGGVTISGNSFTMPAANVTVKAVFERDSPPPQPTTYTIAVQTEGSGTASASPTSATAGTKINLTATASNGYHFKEWQVLSGGVTVSGNSFTMPAANVTVKAVFEQDSPPPQPETVTKLEITGGIAEVPSAFRELEHLNTLEKIMRTMRTAITQTGVPSGNTAVYDVTLMVSTDGGATWSQATKDNFPAGGLTVTLPYPAGTNSSYTFTVVHMFTTSDFGKTPGDIEMPPVTNTVDGLQFTVTGLSPISVGWEQPKTPVTPSTSSGGGGGWSSSTYAVTVEKSEHGKVTSNRTNASSGNTVTLTVTPDSGYVLDALTVTDSRGNEIKLTAQGSGRYTFTMPSRAVTVKAAFAPLPDDTEKPCDGGVDCPSHGFTDLGTVGTWYHGAVDYVLRNNLMGGFGNGQFGPNDNLSRAQFAQILFNKEGRPVVNYLLRYNDVADGTWYTEAVRWATSQGVVSGYGNGMFGPNDSITREQLAVMLWRYAGSPAATDKELHFTDADKASGYALEALRWAVENGVMDGYGNGQLVPQGLATRAQAAQMLKNYLER